MGIKERWCSMVSAIWRTVRVALACAGGAFLANLMNQPFIVSLGLTAIISGGFKMLRDKYKNLWWLPL